MAVKKGREKPIAVLSCSSALYHLMHTAHRPAGFGSSPLGPLFQGWILGNGGVDQGFSPCHGQHNNGSPPDNGTSAANLPSPL